MSKFIVIPWTVALHDLLSVGFPRQEYRSGLPFPSSRDLPKPEIESASPELAGRFFTTVPPGKPHIKLKEGQFWGTEIGKRKGWRIFLLPTHVHYMKTFYT